MSRPYSRCDRLVSRAKVIAALVIPISSDSTEESVGSYVPRVIFFGTIPTSIPVIPVVPAEIPIAPADSIVTPEDSLPVTLELPLVSPFLCSDDSDADSEFELAKQRPERHASITPSFEFPLAPVVAPPEIHSSSSRSSSNSSSNISSGSSLDSLSDSSSVHSSRCDALESSPNSSSKRSLDSSSPSVGLSHKRYRSPTTLVPSSTHVSRLIAPTLANLLPHKRFRDSYAFEVSEEEHMKIGIADVETIADLGISEGVGAPTKDGIGMGVEVSTSDIKENEEEFEVEANVRGMIEIAVDPLATSGISKSTGGDAPDIKGTLYDIAHYMSKVPLDRITEFKTAQRQLEARQLVATKERVRLVDRVRSLGRENLRANKNIGLGNGNDEGGNGNNNGNRNRGGNRNGNHNENDRDARPFRTIGTDAAFSMSWRELMKLMAEVYYPRTEIQKMESELWNLTIKNNDLATYTHRFQEHTMLCTKMVPEEEDRKKNDVKARTTLLLSLPDEHQLRFSKYKTTRELWAAILKTFGANEATKKTKKNLLKQQYGNFRAEGSETLEQTFSRLQDINQIDEDDMEEMDIKWNMALLSMRIDKFWKRTGKKISIQGSDVAGIQDRGRRDNFRQGSKAEEQAPKALMAIDGVGWDWSYMANNREDHALIADEEAPTKFALVANTSTESKVFDNSLCSKDSSAQVESRLVEYKEKEVKYIEKIRTLEFYNESNKECIETLKKKLKTLKQEKEGVDGKLAGLLTASKDLDNLIESQRSDKNKKGLRYTVVPPLPVQLYLSPKKDLSWTGLLECADDTVTDYSRSSPTVESTSEEDQNRNPSVYENVASPITLKPFIKFVKLKDSQSESKTDKKETPKKPPVKYAEQYRKPNKKPNVRGN
nr:reverse transcriptase domain-containing protein [Tanacetum cinerariifolium]